jgi:hypothetical protein
MFPQAVMKYSISIAAAVLILSGVCAALTEYPSTEERKSAVRVSPADAYREVVSGRALLVCAYPEEEVCEKVMLKNSITLKEFEARLPELKKDREIIFYCA